MKCRANIFGKNKPKQKFATNEQGISEFLISSKHCYIQIHCYIQLMLLKRVQLNLKYGIINTIVEKVV